MVFLPQHHSRSQLYAGSQVSFMHQNALIKPTSPHKADFDFYIKPTSKSVLKVENVIYAKLICYLAAC